MILRLLARGRTGRRTAIPARTVETPRRSSVNLFKGHTTRLPSGRGRYGVLDVHVDVERLPKRFVVVDMAVQVHPARREHAHRDVCQYHRRIGVDRQHSGGDPVSGGVQEPAPPVEVVVPDHEDLAVWRLADPGSVGFAEAYWLVSCV